MGLVIMIVGLAVFFGTHLVTTRRDLRARLGDEIFFAFIRDYYEQYAGRRATSADFFRVLREHTSADISDLTTQYFKNAY